MKILKKSGGPLGPDFQMTVLFDCGVFLQSVEEYFYNLAIDGASIPLQESCQDHHQMHVSE